MNDLRVHLHQKISELADKIIFIQCGYGPYLLGTATVCINVLEYIL